MIDASGNMGVGIAPNYKLHVNGSVYGDHYYGNAITLYTRGSGTYNRAWISAKDDAGDFIIEAPLTTDSASGTRAPITLTWRGGFPSKGGLKITGESTAQLGSYEIWHKGNLNMGLTTITKTIQPTTSWSDTGIISSDIGDGVFVLYLDPNHSNGNDGWVPYYAGLFVNYTGTNGSSTEEIILQAASHASYKRLFLRFINTANTLGYRKL
jgi:hypothetical protein